MDEQALPQQCQRAVLPARPNGSGCKPAGGERSAAWTRPERLLLVCSVAVLPGAIPLCRVCAAGPGYGKPDLVASDVRGAGGGEGTLCSCPAERKRGGEGWEITALESAVSPNGGQQPKQKSSYSGHQNSQVTGPCPAFFVNFSTTSIM